VLRNAARGNKEEEEYEEEEEEEEVGYARADEDDEVQEDRALVPHAYESDRGSHVMHHTSAHNEQMGKQGFCLSLSLSLSLALSLSLSRSLSLSLPRACNSCNSCNMQQLIPLSKQEAMCCEFNLNYTMNEIKLRKKTSNLAR
jgi:hypothetical protein